LNFNPLDLLVGALAVWRLSALIAYERGPFKIFEWVRARAGIFHFDNGSPDTDLATSEIQNLVLCVWCSSPWFAGLWVVGYVFAPEFTMIVSTILALSTGAIVLEKINNG